MQSAIVTGAAGFIGSHTADRLLREGWNVTGVDNYDPYYDPAQKRRNISAALTHPNYRFLEVDVREAEALNRAFTDARPDAVIHLAARAGVRASIENPRIYAEVNELGGLNVVECCAKHGGVPLLYASTSSVYGNTAKPPFTEDDPAVDALNPYSASKRSGELMARAFHSLYAQPIAIVRFFTVYGPRGRPDMATHLFTDALREGRAINLHGEDTARDFTFIHDIVDGVMGAVRWLMNGPERFDTFNLGRAEPVPARRLIEELGRAMGVVPNIRVTELQPGEAKVTSADVSKAAQAFGYCPRVSLREGVAEWLKWYETSPESPRAANAS